MMVVVVGLRAGYDFPVHKNQQRAGIIYEAMEEYVQHGAVCLCTGQSPLLCVFRLF